MAGGGSFRGGRTLISRGRVRLGRVFLPAYKGRARRKMDVYVRIVLHSRLGTSQATTTGWPRLYLRPDRSAQLGSQRTPWITDHKDGLACQFQSVWQDLSGKRGVQIEAYMNTPQSPSWMISRHPGTIYSNFFVNIWSIPVGFRPILGGGGDKGDLVERSTRPKPPGEAIAIGFSRVDRMGSTKREITSAAVEEAQRFVAGKPREDADDAQGRSGPSDGQSYLLVNIQQQMGLTKKMRVSLNLILMMRKQGHRLRLWRLLSFIHRRVTTLVFCSPIC
jgi:hypothetical protein